MPNPEQRGFARAGVGGCGGAVADRPLPPDGLGRIARRPLVIRRRWPAVSPVSPGCTARVGPHHHRRPCRLCRPTAAASPRRPVPSDAGPRAIAGRRSLFQVRPVSAGTVPSPFRPGLFRVRVGRDCSESELLTRPPAPPGPVMGWRALCRPYVRVLIRPAPRWPISLDEKRRDSAPEAPLISGQWPS